MLNAEEIIDQQVDSNQIFEKVKAIIKKNKETDLFHKAFLRPIQLELKTWQTSNRKEKEQIKEEGEEEKGGKKKKKQQKEERKGQIGGLPFGLKQIIKKDISLNKYDSDNIKSFDSLPEEKKLDYKFLCNNNYDNLLSLIKTDEGKSLKLAICICMYSEDKNMLKRTLNGVSQNIATFVKNGIPSDQIGVFVIMDGIEVVDPSVVQFFWEMEKENCIDLENEVDPSGPVQLTKTEVNNLEEGEVLNVNNFLFNEFEFNDRKNRRFSSRKNQYKDIKNRLKEISAMQKDKTITLETMNPWLLPYFVKCAKQDYKTQYGKQDDEEENITNDFILQEYGNTISKSRPLIRLALQDAKKYCEEYLTSRQNLALLNSFRLQVDLNNIEQCQDVRIGGHEQTHQNILDVVDDDEIDSLNKTTMNLFMVTKYKNRGKLSSHNWFFNGFCKEFNPEYAVLLDVGLAPEKDALYKMITHMEIKQEVGGVCGYMGLRIERLEDDEEVQSDQIDAFSSLFLKCVDIQRTQQLQYHFAHLVDKPFESMFNFIHVLPGAFSAYRMEALFNEGEQDSELLKQYFKSLEEVNSTFIKKSQFTDKQTILKVLLPQFLYYRCYPHPQNEKTEEVLLYDENVYLAEDRTLCMGIHQNGYNLQYLPDAYAWVDPIKTLNGLLGQRKRWINGSFFAFEKVKNTLNRQNAGEWCLSLQMMFLTFLNILAFVSPALFLFTSHVAMVAFGIYVLNGGNFVSNLFYGWQTIVMYTVDFIYIMLFLTLIFFSMNMTNKNKKFVPYIYITSTMLGLLSITIFVLLSLEIFSQTSAILIDQLQDQVGGKQVIESLRYIIVATFFLYAIPIILYTILYRRCNFIVDIIFSAFSFIFYGPTYLNILNIYALCRIDDISWGTKGLDSEVGTKQKERQETWKKIKLMHVSKYVFWNILTACVLLTFGNQHVDRFYMTYVIMAILIFTLFMKIFLGTIYLIKYKCMNKQITRAPIDMSRDRISQSFELMKNSLYQQIEEQIKKLEQDCVQQQMQIAQIIVGGGSKVHSIGRKRAFKEYAHNFAQRVSKIQALGKKKKKEEKKVDRKPIWKKDEKEQKAEKKQKTRQNMMEKVEEVEEKKNLHKTEKNYHLQPIVEEEAEVQESKKEVVEEVENMEKDIVVLETDEKEKKVKTTKFAKKNNFFEKQKQ